MLTLIPDYALRLHGVSGLGNRVIGCLFQLGVDASAASHYLFSAFQIIPDDAVVANLREDRPRYHAHCRSCLQLSAVWYGWKSLARAQPEAVSAEPKNKPL